MNCSISCLPGSFLNDFSPADSSVRLSSLHLILLFALSLSLCSSSPFSFVLSSLSSISPSLPRSLVALAVSSASQDRHRELLFYMLLNTQVARSQVCLRVCVFSFLFLPCSFHPSVMSAVLQTPPCSQCSELCCTDNPPVGVFACARVCVRRRDCVCAFAWRCMCV